MKRKLLILALASMALPALAADYKIDSSHTFAYFEVSHLGLSTFRGRFDDTNGTLSYDRQKRTGSAEVVIKAASVSTGVPKLDEHLRNPDFFDVEKYPEITFKSRNFQFEEDVLVGVIGDLTLHGVTRPVTLEIHEMDCKPHPGHKKPACGVDAVTTIKRSDFGMKFGIPNVGDEVKILLAVEAIQQ